MKKTLAPDWDEITAQLNRYQEANGGQPTIAARWDGPVSSTQDHTPLAVIEGLDKPTEQLLNLVLQENGVILRKNGPVGKRVQTMTDNEANDSTFRTHHQRLHNYAVNIDDRASYGNESLKTGYHVALEDAEPKLEGIKAKLAEVVDRATASPEGLAEVREQASNASGEGNNAVGDMVKIIDGTFPRSALAPNDPTVARQRAELFAQAIVAVGLDPQLVAIAAARMKSSRAVA